MNTDKDFTKMISIVSVFVLTLIYSVGVSFRVAIFDNLASLFLVIFFIGVVFYEVKRYDFLKSQKNRFFYLVIPFLFSILLGSLFLESDSNIVWQIDSVRSHIPNSISVKEMLEGKLAFNDLSFHQGFVSHLFVGLIFFITQSVTVQTTLLSLLILKFLSVYVVLKLGAMMYSRKVGYIGSLIYLFNPVSLFYSVTFYKEVMVHLLVSLSILSMVRFFKRTNVCDLLLLIISLFVLYYERYYLSILIALVPIFYILLMFSTFSKNKRSILIITSIIALSSLVGLFVYVGYTPVKFMQKLELYRQEHIKLGGFSYSLNYEIPYVIAVIKSFFGPYFSFNKFGVYHGFSPLLIWGALVGHVIYGGSLIGIYYSYKESKYRGMVSLILPVILLSFFMGYVAPWNSRVKESFISIMCLFFSYAICMHSKHGENDEF